MTTMNSLKSEFISTINKCHDTLRLRHSMIGQDAHRHIMSILFVRLLKTHFTDENSILYKKIMNYINNQDGKRKERYTIIFANMSDFNKLIEINNETNNISNYWNKSILNLLSNVFSDIFSFDDDRLKCNSITLSILLREIESLGVFFKDNEEEIKKNSYAISTTIFESFVNSYSNDGSQLGQFHTHKDIIVCGIENFVKPYINDCLQNNIFCKDDLKMYDACAGSGGFLLENYFNLNINPDNLYGQEIDKLTMKHLYLNMILSTETFPQNIHNKNSLTNVPSEKFHIQGLNPPFGLKGIKYTRGRKTGDLKGIKEEYEDIKENTHAFKDIYPIKSNKAESLFLQQAINLMEDNGIVQIVLPYGELVFSNNKSFISIRKKLIEERNIKAFILLPTNLFLSTNIQTFMIIFTKEEKTTENIDFYNLKNGEIIKDKSISLKELREKDYSLKLQDYEEENLNQDIEYTTVGDISIINNGKRIVKSRSPPGDYPVYGGGFATFHTDQYNREGENCKISREGMSLDNCVLRISGKFYQNSQGFTIKSKNEKEYLTEYIWKFLLYNKEKIMKCGRGTAQLAIDVKRFKKIKIPKYSLEKQQEIINDLEHLDRINQNYKNQLKELKGEKEFYYKHNNNDLKNIQKDKETIKLDTIIDFNKKSKSKSSTKKKEGKYNFYCCSNKIHKCDEKLYDEECILISGGGSFIVHKTRNFNCSTDLHIIKSNDEKYSNDYIYYYLIINKYFYEKQMTGVAIKHFTKTQVKNIKIPILILEEQKNYIKIAKAKMEKINSFEIKREELKTQIEELTQIGKNIIEL